MSLRAEREPAWARELAFTELPVRRRAAPYQLHRPHLPLTPPPAAHPAPLAAPPAGTHVSRLYPELLALIFERLPVRDRGRAAQVCRSWRDASDRRSVWRGVEAPLHLRRATPALYASLARRGVRRVQVLSLRRSLRDVLAGLPDLEALSLSGCYNVTDVSLAHAFAAEPPALRRLDLSLCKQVTDASLGRIAQHLRRLEELELGGCGNVTDTGLLLIAWGLRRLRRLDLRSCWHVTDRGIAHLCGAGEARGTPDLEHLGLQDCQRLTDEALRHAAALPRLASLNLSFCAGVTDAGLRHVARAPALSALNLRACDAVTDAGVAYLAEGAPALRSLDVSFCDKVGDEALAQCAQGLLALRSLSLSACAVTDAGVERVARALPELETLNIGQCSRVTDRGLAALAAGAAALRCIDLYGCTGITPRGLDRLCRLPRLTVLNLGLWHVR